MSECSEVVSMATRVMIDRRFCADTYHKALAEAVLALTAENEALRKDAERYRSLRKVTPYRFKKMQDAAVTDGGDVMYFHADRFDAAIDATMGKGIQP